MATAKKKTKRKVPSKGTRASALKQKRARASRYDKIKRIAKRSGVVILILLFVVWAVAWFIISDTHTASANWMKEKTLKASVNAGFKVNEILVEGRVNTDPNRLLGIINVKKEDPIFLFDPKEARDRIKEISWVESVHAERRLPDTVFIKLKERAPFALWHNNEKLSVVDVNGNILSDQNIAQFKDLMMIRGNGASGKAGNLLNILSGEPDLLTIIDHAELIDKRRWDLVLKDMKRVKLPENDIGLALRHLMTTDAQNNILGKESITDIDARYQGRLIIRTKLGTVQDFKAQKTRGSKDEQAGTHL